MSVFTASGVKVSIGPAIVAGNEPEDITAFEGLTYVLIGEVEDLGEFGDSVGVATFSSLSDARVRKAKTVFDAGTFDMVVGADNTDPGQQALAEAVYDYRDFAFRVEYTDKLTTGGTNTIEYFFAKVMGGTRNVGNVENIIRRTYNIGINSPITLDPAT